MLRTERCELRLLSNKEFESVMRLYVNEDVRKYLGGTVDGVSFSIRFQMMLDSAYYWTVYLRQSGDFIGLVFLDHCYDRIHTEIGFQFLPAFWGQGYAKEVVEEVINYGLNTLHLPIIVAETQTLNERSCKLLKKVGMMFEKNLDRFGEQQSLFSIQHSEAVILTQNTNDTTNFSGLTTN